MVVAVKKRKKRTTAEGYGGRSPPLPADAVRTTFPQTAISVSTPAAPAPVAAVRAATVAAAE